MNKIIIVLVILVALLAGFIVGSNVERPIGASPGPDHYNFETFFNGVRAIGFVQGGGILAFQEKSGTDSITAAQFCDYRVINYSATTSDLGSATTTLPSETAVVADCLPNVGDSRTILFRNTAGSGTTTDLAAGTDTTLMSTDGGNVIIDGGNAAWITYQYIAASTTITIVEEMD